MCLLDFDVNFQLWKLLNFNPISFQVSLICFLLLRFIYQLKCVISYMALKSTLICSIIYSFNKYCIYCESDSARSLGLNNEQIQLGGLTNGWSQTLTRIAQIYGKQQMITMKDKSVHGHESLQSEITNRRGKFSEFVLLGSCPAVTKNWKAEAQECSTVEVVGGQGPTRERARAKKDKDPEFLGKGSFIMT